MEIRKPRGSTDELAVVKAAAWAWYHHGSGSQGKPMMHEVDITRTRRVPKPSRYKLEAMRDIEEETQTTSTPNRSDNSLLDTYEIERISQQLDYLILESSSSICAKLHGKYLGRHDQDHENKVVSSLESDRNGIKMKKKKKKFRGFWGRHAVVCGTREDVVDTRVSRDRWWPEKQVPMVRLANCRPRTTHA